MARAGAPLELIAHSSGTVTFGMVAKVYGRFKPDAEERDRWERIAASRDADKSRGADKWKGLGAEVGASERKRLTT